METEQVVEQQPVAQPGEVESPDLVTTEPEVASAPEVEEIDPDVADALKDLGLEPEIKGRVSKKILKEIGKRKAAEEKAREEAEEKARWRDEVYRRDAIQQVTPAPQEIQIDTSDLPIPTREAFDHDEDQYQAAIAERAAVIAYRRERARERQQEAVQQQRQTVDTKTQWGQEGRKKFPDFDVVYTVPVTDQMGSAIMGNERGHEVAYWLGKNPQEAHRIANMHPVDQSIEIQKIAKKLATSQPKTTTTAPTPTNPMGNRETVTKSVDLYDPNISYEDYRRIRLEQMRKKAAGG